MLGAQSSSTAWPFLDLQSTDWVDSFEVCAPAECFLFITSSLLPYGDQTNSTDEATGTCFHHEVRQQHADTGTDSGSTTCGASKAQQPEQAQQAAVTGIVHAVYSQMQQLWFTIGTMFSGYDDADGCASNAQKQGQHGPLQACIQTLVDVVLAPHKPYMKELHAIPSPGVVQSLAAVPRVSEALAFFAEFKASSVAKPTISFCNFISLSPRIVGFSISNDVVAAHVYLETNISGKFSDNGMLLLPWQQTSIAFLAEQPLQVQALADTLTALSVFDTSFTM